MPLTARVRWRELFPGSAWVFRHVFSKRFGLVVLAAACVLPVLFHLRTYWFAKMIEERMASMRSLRVGMPETDVLRVLPGLRREEDGCPPQHKCFRIEEEIPFASQKVQAGHSRGWRWSSAIIDGARKLPLRPYWFGLRYVGLKINVQTEDGRLSHYGYQLSTYASESKGLFGHIQVRAIGGVLRGLTDDSPNYGLGGRTTLIPYDAVTVFSVYASDSERDHAFDVDTSCLRGFSTCKDAYSLARHYKDDWRKIMQSHKARVTSQDPCPERIIYARGRDSKAIAVVRVVAFDPQPKGDYVLKLHALKLEVIRNLRGQYDPWGYIPATVRDLPGDIPNPDVKAMRRGELLIATTGSSDGCDFVQATAANLAAVRRGMADSMPDHGHDYDWH